MDQHLLDRHAKEPIIQVHGPLLYRPGFYDIHTRHSIMLPLNFPPRFPSCPPFMPDHFFFRIRTRPPGLPGMAPRMSSRFSSGLTSTTSRFLTVIRLFPIWPGNR